MHSTWTVSRPDTRGRWLIPQLPSRAQAIARDLRQQIVRGEMGPGSQLPTWDDLERDYDVKRTTLSRVLRQLKNAGFVYASSTRGTFVVDRPPHSHRYALVFKQQPDSPGWNWFWRMLANQAVVAAAGGVRSRFRSASFVTWKSLPEAVSVRKNGKPERDGDCARFCTGGC